MASFQPPFIRSDAVLCMKLSRWAYESFERDPAPLVEKLKTAGLTLTGTMSEKSPGGGIFKRLKNDTQAFFAEGDGRCFICFRGSEPKLWDWLTDFRIDKDPVKIAGGSEIHEGFHSAIMGPKTKAIVDDWIKQAAGRPIILAGHSLGGALAACLAVLSSKPFAACYTYGQPRIGLIARAPDTPICRIVNKADIVPRVPVDFAKLVTDTLKGNLKGFLANAGSNILGHGALDKINYRHIGQAYVIGQDGKLAPDGEAAYGRFIQEKIRASIIELLEFIHQQGEFDYTGDLISDHFSDNYLKSVEALG